MVEENRVNGERGEGAPLIPSIPQDKRQSARDDREGAPGGRRKSRKGIGGPKTPEGKAIVARNAVKHGVLAETPVLALVESQEKWEELRRDVLDWFGLEGPFLESLGTRAAMLIWRLERAARLETEATRHYQQDVPEDWKSSMRMEGLPIPDRKTKERVEEEYRMLMARLLPGDEVIAKVMRYETKVHRFLLQTLYQIMVLKGLKRSPTSRFFGVAELNPPGVSAKNSPPGFQGDGGE